MNDFILTEWNKRITNADTVYLLGDITWKVCDESISLMSKLKGNLVLVTGNHDALKDLRYRRLFSEICDVKYVEDTVKGKNVKVICSHYPYAFWSGNNSNNKNHTIHLYGHVHNSKEHYLYLKILEMLASYNIEAKAYNVGCMLDYMGYIPRTLEEIIKGAENER